MKNKKIFFIKRGNLIKYVVFKDNLLTKTKLILTR